MGEPRPWEAIRGLCADPSVPTLYRSSGENRTTMHKCYTFLIFMVLLLPSLGLSR